MARQDTKRVSAEWDFDSDRKLAAAAFDVGGGWTTILLLDGKQPHLPLIGIELAYSGSWVRADESRRNPVTGFVPDPFGDWLQERVEAFVVSPEPPQEGLVTSRLDGIRLSGLLTRAREELTPSLLWWGLDLRAKKGPRRRVDPGVERELSRLAIRFEELQGTGKALALLAKEEGATYSATKSRLDRARDLGLLTRPGKGLRGEAKATDKARRLI